MLYRVFVINLYNAEGHISFFFLSGYLQTLGVCAVYSIRHILNANMCVIITWDFSRQYETF